MKVMPQKFSLVDTVAQFPPQQGRKNIVMKNKNANNSVLTESVVHQERIIPKRLANDGTKAKLMRNNYSMKMSIELFSEEISCRGA